MNTANLQLRGPITARLTPSFKAPIGQILVDTGVLDHNILLKALHVSNHLKVPIEDVLVAEGWVTPSDILMAQARRFAAIPVTIDETPPDPSCLEHLDPIQCLQLGICPWMRLGGALVVATAYPDAFPESVRALGLEPNDVIMAIASAEDIQRAVAQHHDKALAVAAEHSVPEDHSSRGLHVLATPRQIRRAGVLAFGMAALFFWQASIVFGAIAIWAFVSLAAVALMKVAALAARLTAPSQTLPSLPEELPVVSLLIPLFQEKEIAGALIERLSRLSYPKSKLEALLILEAEDKMTRATLAKTDLPAWMRVVVVPPGEIQTKPRALNYARHFARGDIIGVYDAEDDPAPDQIHRVVAKFAASPQEVGCLQGVLDYYNPHANWLARCFTIEYAAWFRVLLPGLARLGIPIPLGGTTVFFRRQMLDELQGWDAHNVTEDADLGMRIARYGYRTELVETVTLEEANCRFWPWVRQRSRWLKGYVMTYAVHMRRPLQLLRDLGWRQFIGFQVFFFCSLTQFALAPFLWSFWALPFGLPHPVADELSQNALVALTALFITTEAIGLALGIVAVSSARHRSLTPWVPTLFFYFPLAALAMYKALWECVTRPFYWDKTSHGHTMGSQTLSHNANQI